MTICMRSNVSNSRVCGYSPSVKIGRIYISIIDIHFNKIFIEGYWASAGKRRFAMPYLQSAKEPQLPFESINWPFMTLTKDP